MSLRIIQYNTFLRPAGLFHDGQRERAYLIPSLLRDLPGPAADVVVCCEVFDPESRDILSQQMKEMGWDHQTQVVGHQFDPPWYARALGCFPRLWKTRLIATNGGVMIFSRIPFGHIQYVSFPNQEIHGTDALAAKGFIHVSLTKAGQRVHLFATHLQAWNNHLAWSDRAFELLSICDQMRRVSAQESCFLVGDLNYDYIGNANPAINAILRAHGLCLPRTDPTSLPATFDSRTNDLVGRDGTPLPSRQWLDYGLFSTLHHPPRSCIMNCVRVKSSDAIPYNDSCCEKVMETHNLSDHYPVICDYEL